MPFYQEMNNTDQLGPCPIPCSHNQNRGLCYGERSGHAGHWGSVVQHIELTKCYNSVLIDVEAKNHVKTKRVQNDITAFFIL